ncbi:MAG: FkbM family methyltransferase [Selenomonadaceae bacterium]|nr:FkbM family methyltransferase [Selenomonadaceae bacterium]
MSADFIKMVSEVHTERFNAHIQTLARDKTPCGIFFGFVLVPANVAAHVQGIRDRGINLSCVIVLADVQANALRKFVDVPVITLEDFPRFGEENFPAKPKEIFNVTGLHDAAFVPFFARHGMEVLTHSDDGQFFFLMTHLPELYSVHESLASDESKKVFRASIKGDLTGKISDYRFAPEPQYFLEGFTPAAGDIAVDGGAYDGTTALAFAKCGAKVFAFEMDETNYKNCAARLERFGGGYDIALENFGLSDKEGTEKYFRHEASSFKRSDGNLIANFIDLDTYVARKNLPRVDYIKLDIEGAELDMLRGAAKTITRCKPKMAVSAYHKLEDLWTLATYIKSLRPDYEFEFRHYQIDCTDYILDDEERALLNYFGLPYLLPTTCEKVLYCR